MIASFSSSLLEAKELIWRTAFLCLSSCFIFLPNFSLLVFTEIMATSGASPGSLLELLATLIQAEAGNSKLVELRTQLNANPHVIDTWKNRSEAQWERRHGDAGIDIYNHLNAETQGIELLLIVVIHNDNDMDIDIPLFDPSVFRTRQLPQFPFFDPVIEKYLKHFGESALLARDDVINQVNAYIANRDVEKYQPIVCSTSRGMGKSAFIEAIGMQLVKPQLQNQLILMPFLTVAFFRLILLVLLQKMLCLSKKISKHSSLA